MTNLIVKQDIPISTSFLNRDCCCLVWRLHRGGVLGLLHGVDTSQPLRGREQTIACNLWDTTDPCFLRGSRSEPISGEDQSSPRQLGAQSVVSLPIQRVEAVGVEARGLRLPERRVGSRAVLRHQARLGEV